MFNDLDIKRGNYSYRTIENDTNTINREIQKINHKRIFAFSIVTAFFELLLILFYDIPRIVNDGSVDRYKIYLVLHILILITSLSIIFLLLIYKKNRNNKIYSVLDEFVVLFFMSFIALIGVMDYNKSGQILSYLSMLMLSGMTVLIKPPRNYIVYSIPHAIFLTLIFLTNNNKLIVADVINSSMYFFCVLVLSKMMYENQFSHIVKNIALKQSNRDLEYISNHDSLTKLFNRRYFETKLRSKFREDKSFIKKDLILTMIDIDYFKNINDKYGHACGDLVLQELASKIKGNIRQEDLLARWGGEEFIILFSDTSMEDCKVIVNRIRKAIETEKIQIDGHTIYVTASFGMCKFKGNKYEDIDDWYGEVDTLLYIAKNKGRNRIEICESSH